MDDKQFAAAMEHIVAALKEKGYDPYAQLTGHITENDAVYITSHILRSTPPILITN